MNLYDIDNNKLYHGLLVECIDHVIYMLASGKYWIYDNGCIFAKVVKQNNDCNVILYANNVQYLNFKYVGFYPDYGVKQ